MARVGDIGAPRVDIRVIDAYRSDRHQDVLMVSSIDRPVLHYGFVPSSDVQERPYSSSLPYRAGGRKFLIGVVPDPASPRPEGRDEFDGSLGRRPAGACCSASRSRR